MAQLRNRLKRLRLELPVRIVGRDAQGGDFEEQTRSHNVSGTGLVFHCHRKLPVGEHLQVEIELSESLRSYFGGSAIYQSRAVVTRSDRLPNEETYQVGVRFVPPSP
jgi:hypothetical protein